MKTHRIAAISLLLVSALLPWTTSAHHSIAIYDSENPVELTGRVVEWQFTNPHVVIILAVENEDGEVVNWSLE